MDASGNGVAPFAIDQGIVKILNARIQGALIDDLVVKTSNIEPGAVSRYFTATGSGTFNLVVNHGLGSPLIKLEYKMKIISVGEFGSAGCILKNVTDGNVEMEGFAVQSPYTGIAFSSVLFTPPTDRATTTFSLQTFSNNARIEPGTLFALVFKR